MEKIVEVFLMLLWDLGKTIILQWLMDTLKKWWESTKNQTAFQYA